MSIDSAPAPAADQAAAAGAPSTTVDAHPWMVYGHYLGGDAIHIQATEEEAQRFLAAHLDIDLDDECGCEFGCGPIWWPREDPNAPDDADSPAWATPPPPLEEEQGTRIDGSPRTSVYGRAEVLAVLTTTVD